MTEVEQPPRRARNENYAISFRQEAVRLVEAGVAQCHVRQQLGIGQTTLRVWLKQYGTAVYSQMRRKSFTASQKHQIVRELLAGRLSEDEALLKYGLRLKSTLRAWVSAQQAAASAPPSLPAPPAASPATALAAQLRHTQWQLEALHTLIDQAEVTYGIDIRKKAGAKPS
ncbi:hypothetical protein GCM10027422_47290 [Hymenobacter arcticus]